MNDVRCMLGTLARFKFNVALNTVRDVIAHEHATDAIREIR